MCCRKNKIIITERRSNQQQSFHLFRFFLTSNTSLTQKSNALHSSDIPFFLSSICPSMTTTWGRPFPHESKDSTPITVIFRQEGKASGLLKQKAHDDGAFWLNLLFWIIWESSNCVWGRDQQDATASNQLLTVQDVCVAWFRGLNVVHFA